MSICAGALGVLAATALGVPAQASEVKAVCTFTAEAKAWNKEDSSLGVRLTGGKGAFAVGKLAVACVGVAKGTPDARVLGMGAEGSYTSLICGTGKVIGRVTRINGPVKYQNLLVGKKFAVHFVALTGLFFWHDWDKPPNVLDLKDELDRLGAGPFVKPPEPKNWQLAGEMGIGPPTQKEPPSGPNPITNDCVKAFSPTGAFLIDEDGT